MDRREAIDIIKELRKNGLTNKQIRALDIANEDMQLRIKRPVKGKNYLSDRKYHFCCHHCNGLIRPTTSERICCLCGGEISWHDEIEKGNVILV